MPKHTRISIFFMLCIVIFLAACSNTPGSLEPTAAMTRTTNPSDTASPTDALLPPATATFPAGYVPPMATVDPLATATSLPPTDPVIQEISTLPSISQDVLFIADGALKRWNHTTNQIETLLSGGTPPSNTPRNSEWNSFVGDIANFSVSRDGRSIVASRFTGELKEGDRSIMQYELLFLDLSNPQPVTIVSNLPDADRFALSPNGAMVAYVTATPNNTPPDWQDDTLWLVDLPSGAVRSTIPCEGYCSSVVWHVDSDRFFWTDRAALWLQNVATNQSELIEVNHGFENATVEAEGSYSAIAWSPDGRFLLAWKGYYEGAERVVIDLASKAVMDITSSLMYGDAPFSELTWTQDSRLYVVRPAASENEGPTAELWHVDAGTSQLVLDQTMSLSDKPFMAIAPAQLSDGRFVYALVNSTGNDYGLGYSPVADDSTAGLYNLASFAGQPQRINAILATRYQGESRIVWQSDGTGAIIHQPNSDITLYAASDNTNLYNINPLLGSYPHQFTWITTP